MAQDDRGEWLRMTKKKYVILRESFPNVKDDRRIWLRINSGTEESLFAAPRSFADAQDDRGEWLRMTGGGQRQDDKKEICHSEGVLPKCEGRPKNLSSLRRDPSLTLRMTGGNGSG